MKAVLSIKVDPDVRDNARELARSAGLSLSAIVNAYLRHVCTTRRIEIFAPEQMSPKLEALIAEVEKERKAGEASEVFNDVDHFLADLQR